MDAAGSTRWAPSRPGTAGRSGTAVRDDLRATSRGRGWPGGRPADRGQPGHLERQAEKRSVNLSPPHDGFTLWDCSLQRKAQPEKRLEQHRRANDNNSTNCAWRGPPRTLRQRPCAGGWCATPCLLMCSRGIPMFLAGRVRQHPVEQQRLTVRTTSPPGYWTLLEEEPGPLPLLPVHDPLPQGPPHSARQRQRRLLGFPDVSFQLVTPAGGL